MSRDDTWHSLIQVKWWDLNKSKWLMGISHSSNYVVGLKENPKEMENYHH